jgi:Flp pilus assembly protein TadG
MVLGGFGTLRFSPGYTTSSARARRRGQALVELAIVVPILALIFLSIVQFAFIFAAQIGVTNAVREAARVAAVSATVTDAEAAARATDVYNRLTNSTNGLLKQNVFAFNPSNFVTSGTADTQVCYRDGPAAATGEYVVFVKVEAGYRHPVIIPLLGAILDGIDGVSDGGLRIATGEEMRVENVTLLSSPAIAECYNP